MLVIADFLSINYLAIIKVIEKFYEDKSSTGGTMKESNKANNKRSSKGFKRILSAFAFTVVIALALVLGYGYHTLSSVSHDNLEDKDLGIQEESFTENDGIINILLMGIDSRAKDFTGRSDAMMILTIDPVHDKLKLTSLMRDSYVEIEGFGYDKLTHAYAYGQGYLAVKTVNTNFGLNIEDYVVVDFSGLETMVDQLGGINITLTEEEISPLNTNIEEQSRLHNKEADYIYEPGSHHMNGLQAVAYARIRKTSGGDYQRTERQREVLEKMLYKLKDSDITTFVSLVKNMLPYVKTSLGSSEIISLGTKVFTSDINTIEQKRFPLDDYSYGGFANNRWHLMYDVEPTKEQLYAYLFEDIAPEEGAVD
ncbi:LCP family protein [Alloiococcus sp. CFN-8]|uniref:LCP family protein n=1 Tax=Alloiococcus sp. CFN-8 TaxID=3416081 RepID=UPI003CEA5091